MSPMQFDVSGDGQSTSAMLYPADTANRLDALLVLAHGAGAGQSHPFMVRYARGLAERGLDVVTFNFPYMDAKRKSPDRAPVLEDAFRRVVPAAAAHRHVHATRVFIGGKSMGGRMATHLAASPAEWPADAPALNGVIALGYPLKGGKNDRVSHLFKMTVPALIVQGTRDNFGGPGDVRAALEGHRHTIQIHTVPTGDHSFNVLKSSGRTQEEADREIWDGIVGWIGTVASGHP